MDIVQVTRRIVDQQVRPAQRGTTLGDGGERGGACFLVRTGADGIARRSGVYGRARFGRERYLTVRQ